MASEEHGRAAGPPYLVDSHCHLGDDAADVVARAREAGVAVVVDVGIDAASTRAARERAHTLTGVRFTAGIHPCDADRLDAEWDAIAEAARDPACIAVGETGLDFHWDRATRAEQHRAFGRHLELAEALGLPCVVHCRDAFDATLDVISAHPGVGCVMHCFSGGVGEARRALDLGCLLSFAGPVTYPRADAIRAAAAFAPLDRILVETDAPFLPPQGRRGRRNEPAWVVAVAESLARVRGCGFAELARATSANADRVLIRAR